jgi:hypothetical protein
MENGRADDSTNAEPMAAILHVRDAAARDRAIRDAKIARVAALGPHGNRPAS